MRQTYTRCNLFAVFVPFRHKKAFSFFLRVDVVLRDATYYVGFYDARQLPPPFKIENLSPVSPCSLSFSCIFSALCFVLVSVHHIMQLTKLLPFHDFGLSPLCDVLGAYLFQPTLGSRQVSPDFTQRIPVW